MKITHFFTIFCISAFFYTSNAHIDKTSLSIKGGETFKTGDKVLITWKIAVFHNRPHIIYYSPGPNQSWQKIDSIPEKSGVMDMSYTWTVPQTPTQNGRIRIFQSFVPSPGEQTNDYTIVSNTFIITSGTTAVISGKTSDRRRAIRTGQPGSKGAKFDLNGRLFGESYFTGNGRRGTAFRRIVGW